jgi:hypothetical protein
MSRLTIILVAMILGASMSGCAPMHGLIYCIAVDHDQNRRCT